MNMPGRSWTSALNWRKNWSHGHDRCAHGLATSWKENYIENAIYATTIGAPFFDIKRPDNVPETVQYRAYPSPTWYTPQ